MIKQNNVALKPVLNNYSIQEPIADFIPSTAGKAAAWNAAGEVRKTAVDGS